MTSYTVMSVVDGGADYEATMPNYSQIIDDTHANYKCTLTPYGSRNTDGTYDAIIHSEAVGFQTFAAAYTDVLGLASELRCVEAFGPMFCYGPSGDLAAIVMPIRDGNDLKQLEYQGSGRDTVTLSAPGVE
jgi:hypothetical protein